MKKTLIGLLVIVMGTTLLTGCTAKEADMGLSDNLSKIKETTKGDGETDEWVSVKEQVDYDALYEPVFDEVLEAIKDGYDYDKEYKYISNGIMEKIMYPNDQDLLEAVGYVMTDISGDDVPELLIGCDEDFPEVDPQSYIYNVYTIKDDEPFQVIDGWARSSYRWMGDGYFYYCGSGGAAITLFGKDHLSKDGCEEVWEDFYFTDDADGQIALYHNTSGIFDPNVSEKYDMSEDSFYAKMDEYEAECRLLTWTPIGSKDTGR